MPGVGRGGGKLTAMVGGACISQQKRKNLSTEEKISQQRRKISQPRKKSLNRGKLSLNREEKISQQERKSLNKGEKSFNGEEKYLNQGKNYQPGKTISQQERKSLNKGGVFLFCCCQPANGGRITGIDDMDDATSFF